MTSPTRREALAAGAVAVAAGLSPAEPSKLNGRIKHSAVSWCFMAAGEKWSLDKLCEISKGFGVTSVEIVAPDDFATLKKHGLTCAIASNTMPGEAFMCGFNNPKFNDELIGRKTKGIDACADFGCPSVIAFTGYKFVTPDDPKSGEISPDDGAKNCVNGLKRLMAHAEKKGINVCIEHLNTRDNSHPMKGHPGYQGDNLDYLAKIVRAVGSPRMKLLFDVYHVQIMRRRDPPDRVQGHHRPSTAGNPGRASLDDTQEINYPPIMKLVDIKYAGCRPSSSTRDPKARLARRSGCVTFRVTGRGETDGMRID